MDDFRGAYPTANGRRRVALHKARLTTRTVADAKPGDRRYIVWDDELTGFGVRISPSGLRAFLVQYRTHEGGRRATSRKQVLGHFPALTPARARARAREVLRTVAEWRATGDGGAPPIPTLRRAFQGYLRSRLGIAGSARSQYRRLFERHAPRWLDQGLDELGREDVERRILTLGHDAGPTVANAFVKLLGAVYRGACADNEELRDPVAEWRLGGGKLHRTPRRTIAPPAEVLPRWRRGLEANVPEVMRDMVWMGLFAGLRVSEVSGLRWGDIDASQSWLRIRETKSGRPLKLPVTRQVRAVLERRRESPGADGGWVFPGPGELGPYTRAGNWYARISQVADSKFWFHACRNCYVTVAVRDLMLPESLVKRLVNHRARGDVTQGYATQWTLEQPREPSQRIADRIDSLIGQQGEVAATERSAPVGSSGNATSVESHAGPVVAAGRAPVGVR